MATMSPASLLLHLCFFFSPEASEYLRFLLLGSPCGYKTELPVVNINPATHRLQERFNSSNFIGYFTERFLNIWRWSVEWNEMCILMGKLFGANFRRETASSPSKFETFGGLSFQRLGGKFILCNTEGNVWLKNHLIWICIFKFWQRL